MPGAVCGSDQLLPPSALIALSPILPMAAVTPSGSGQKLGARICLSGKNASSSRSSSHHAPLARGSQSTARQASTNALSPLSSNQG